MTPPITSTTPHPSSYWGELSDSGEPPQRGPYLSAPRKVSQTEIYETKPPATPIADTARSIWDSVVSWWNGPEPLPEPAIQTEDGRADFDPIASSHRIYEATQGGLTGLGTDENGVTDELKDLTPEQNRVLDKVHLSHYGVSVREHTEDDLSGLRQEEASARLRGEQLAGDAMALGDAFRYGTGTLWDLARTGTDEAKVFATLEGKTPDELREIERVFTHRFGISLSDALASELSGHDLAEAQALLSGREATAQAVRLQRALEGWSTDTEAIEHILTTAPAEQREKIVEEYTLFTGQTLDDAFTTTLWGAERDRAHALLHGDSATARAAALFAAQLGPGTDEARIRTELSGLTREELHATKAAYKRLYQRTLSRDLQSELSGTDYEITLSLLKGQEVTPAQSIRHAVEGLGTDEATLLDSLRGRSTEELVQIRADYLQRYGETLDTRVLSELSGRDHFLAKQYLQGTPEDAETALAQLRERVEFERAGASGYLLDQISGKGELLDQNLQKAEMTLEAIQADGSVSSEEYALLVERYRYASLDLESYKTAKDSAAETAGTVGAVAAGAASMLGTGGMSTQAVVGVASSAGGTGYVIGKATIAGKAYDRQGMLVDGTVGVVEGGALGITGGVGLGRVREVGGHFLGGALGGATRETLDQKTWQTGVLKGIQQVGKAAVQEGGVGIIAGQVFKAGSYVVTTGYRNSKGWFYDKKLPEGLRPVFAEVNKSPLFGIRAQEHFEELRKRFGDDKLVEMSKTKPANLQAELLLLELEHFDPALGSMLKINNKQLVLNEDIIKRVKRSMSSFEYARGRIPEEIIQSLNERFFDNMLIEKQRQSEM